MKYSKREIIYYETTGFEETLKKHTAKTIVRYEPDAQRGQMYKEDEFHD
jgi:hypothetical protein